MSNICCIFAPKIRNCYEKGIFIDNSEDKGNDYECL